MKIKDFLDKCEEELPKIVHFCTIHMLEKKYKIEEDEIEENDLKEFLINYDNYEKLLNDYANVIYRQYESSKEEVYETICEYLNENSDNRYLFEFRLKRIVNQEPTKYLQMEDVEMRNAAILRVDDKINLIEASSYYKEHEELASKELKALKKSLTMVKRAVGMV